MILYCSVPLPAHNDASALLVRSFLLFVDGVIDTLHLVCHPVEIQQYQANLNVADVQALVLLASQHRKISGQIDVGVLKNIAEQIVSGCVPSVPLIAKAVAKRLGIKLNDLRSSTRLAKVVRARALAILLARKFTTLSLHDIGQYFGGRDHSTVLHSCRKTEKLLDTDAELAAAKLDVEIDIQSRKCSL